MAGRTAEGILGRRANQTIARRTEQNLPLPRCGAGEADGEGGGEAHGVRPRVGCRRDGRWRPGSGGPRPNAENRRYGSVSVVADRGSRGVAEVDPDPDRTNRVARYRGSSNRVGDRRSGQDDAGRHEDPSTAVTLCIVVADRVIRDLIVVVVRARGVGMQGDARVSVVSEDVAGHDVVVRGRAREGGEDADARCPIIGADVVRDGVVEDAIRRFPVVRRQHDPALGTVEHEGIAGYRVPGTRAGLIRQGKTIAVVLHSVSGNRGVGDVVQEESATAVILIALRAAGTGPGRGQSSGVIENAVARERQVGRTCHPDAGTARPRDCEIRDRDIAGAGDLDPTIVAGGIDNRAGTRSLESQRLGYRHRLVVCTCRDCDGIAGRGSINRRLNCGHATIRPSWRDTRGRCFCPSNAGNGQARYQSDTHQYLSKSTQGQPP